MKYLNRFLHLKCAPDLLALKLFPNVKEISESMAAYQAALTYLSPSFSLADPSVTVVVVGDGHMPRTGAMFAYRSKWNVKSIDPQMRPRHLPIERLATFRSRMGELYVTSERNQHIIVVAVHSHCPWTEIERSVKPGFGGARALISIPCCNFHTEPDSQPTWEYADDGILSPYNKIRIWRDT